MGPELALALAAGGTLAQMKGQRDMRNERRDILNRSLQRTNETADKAAQSVVKEGAAYTGEQRTQAMQAAEDAAYQQAQKDLGGAGGNVITAAGDGNTSADFVKAKADKAVSDGNRIMAIAREMAKTRAPGQLQTDEGIRRGNLASQIGSNWSTTRNLNQADTLDADAVHSDLADYGALASAVGTAALAAPSLAGGGAVGPGLQSTGTGFWPATTSKGSLTPASSSFFSPAGSRIRFG